MGEYGDITRFNSHDQIIAYAGLDCSRNQSDISNFKDKTIKHGSPHLRYNLLNSIGPIKLFNPVFREYYNKKCLIEHKARRVAEIHSAKK